MEPRKTFRTFDSYDGIAAYYDTLEEARGMVYNGAITELKDGGGGREWDVEEGKLIPVDWSARFI